MHAAGITNLDLESILFLHQVRQQNAVSKKKILVPIAIPVVLLLSGAIPYVVADPPLPAPAPPTQCTSQISTGWSSQPIINATMHVINDEDSGLVGYWALDDYQKTMTVWENSGTSPAIFCALVQYIGEWHTFQGALSPQNGVAEPNDGSGSFSGGYVAIFTATFLANGSSEPLTGSIGNFNYGGTKADILLGSYAGGQTGAPNKVDWSTFYFTGVSGFTQTAWAWVYIHGDGAAYGSMWVNALIGSFGDIVTT